MNATATPYAPAQTLADLADATRLLRAALAPAFAACDAALAHALAHARATLSPAGQLPAGGHEKETTTQPQH